MIFQSWKTNTLREKICNNVVLWSRLNPEYDYFLFDDNAVESFILTEYGQEIYSAYSCVNVGAAKCDVWRLLVIYLFGGIYFDLDTTPKSPFSQWGFGNHSVVTGRSCNNKRHKGGCAHQWGLIYTPRHPVIYAAINETLNNLAIRTASHVYDISFWCYYHAWRNGPYNQSYMPNWGEAMGGRVVFSDEEAKDAMVEDNGHWPNARSIWKSECM
ncbi:predicted protein [Thalassiosira pseudonana CCMP1335]|uniref:Uncharacterized protein n=1 Tax=Thalassiosira pseudonana TaxID=35128 RepID=B8LCU2_THAPS|nr:predicted protein [Thalassiosira pseudonana CCMP1335]EED86850.1 predicted protein [Thalassiosira pseudonana CCMP1335]